MFQPLPRYSAVLSAIFAVFFGLGCAEEDDTPNGEGEERVVQSLMIENDQEMLLPSSVLIFRLNGSSRMVARRAEVEFGGASGTGREIKTTAILDADPGEDFPRTRGDQGDIIVEVPVEDDLWDAVSPSPNANYLGDITVRLVDEIGIFAEGTLQNKSFSFRSEFPPDVGQVPGGEVFVNQHIPVDGTNFLRPEEGTTWAVVDGTFTYDDTSIEPRTISSRKVAMVWDQGRTSAKLPIDPTVFGVQPGSFEGSLSFENELSTGETFAGNAQSQFSFHIQQSFLASLDPDAGSRGQKITFQGRGFVPADGSEGISMLFRFDGVFTYEDGSELELKGEDALEKVPDDVLSEEEALIAVWYEIQDGNLYGLGARQGKFEGAITPILIGPWGEQVGLSVDVDFEVLPSRQVVFIKYLPGFSKGLEKYGLQNVEFEIRDRILEVVNRDYDGVNVHFQDEPVTEFLDYATIEVGGPDPTGGNKFGYDNTCNVQAEKCKDTDNLYLADYLGGKNAASADEFNTPFGGVFIESFDYFSPTLSENDDGSEAFDDILGPFMPALEGTPVKGTEWPDGPRTDEIEKAIGLVGSVVGNTISHEIGHSIGLAFYPQDRIRPGEAFHNRIPCDNCMMDSGGERPFEERAEVNGLGPAKFNERNLDYLKEILPVP